MKLVSPCLSAKARRACFNPFRRSRHSPRLCETLSLRAFPPRRDKRVSIQRGAAAILHAFVKLCVSVPFRQCETSVVQSNAAQPPFSTPLWNFVSSCLSAKARQAWFNPTRRSRHSPRLCETWCLRAFPPRRDKRGSIQRSAAAILHAFVKLCVSVPFRQGETSVVQSNAPQPPNPCSDINLTTLSTCKSRQKIYTLTIVNMKNILQIW